MFENMSLVRHYEVKGECYAFTFAVVGPWTVGYRSG